MNKFTPFKIGLALLLIGSIWTAISVSSVEKIDKELNLDSKERSTLDLELKDKGLGFYKITIPKFSEDTVYIKIFDPHGNLINLKKIETKMSVNYFEFEYGGMYTLEITNFSEKPTLLNVEFGNTGVTEITIPSVIAFVGVLFLVWLAYKKLLNYNTAHPEKKRP